MSTPPNYDRNGELFTEFHRLQAELTGWFAAHPACLRAWLDARPAADAAGEQAGPAGESRVPQSWRTARLSAARRRTLLGLLDRAQGPNPQTAPLAAWLLESLPVCSYCAIIASIPDLHARFPEAEACLNRLQAARDRLLRANFGLARAAASRREREEFSEMLSAALHGLLDAIDRYVPGPRASRFAHFAGYWIRHHLNRRAQKCAGVVSFPIHQHRIGRRIRRYLARREAERLPPPTEEELCAELKLRPSALRFSLDRPVIVSLHAPVGGEPDAVPLEQLLHDPAPEPDAVLEQAEIAAHLGGMLRSRLSPETRVILAYSKSIGTLAEAAEDYLAQQHQQARERLRMAGGR